MDKQTSVPGYMGIDESLNKFVNSPAIVAKAKRAKEHLSKIENLSILDKK